MECLIHSPVFNCVKMAWVAGVGGARAGGWTRGEAAVGILRHDLVGLLLCSLPIQQLVVPSPVTQFIEGGRQKVSETVVVLLKVR